MGSKILVVDNHPMVLRLISNLLEKQGHEVRTAEDGLSALDLLKSYTPDIIFVDLVMPNISGEKLCRIIRNMPHLQGVYLVILSAIAAEEELDFLALGADACIAKGSMANLAKHVARVIELASPEGRQGEAQEDILGIDEVATREITRELLSSQKHFEIILRNMSEGILEFAANKKIIFANPTAVSLSGIPEEMLLGREFTEIFCNHSLEVVTALLRTPMDAPRKTLEESPVLLNGRQVSLHFQPVIGGIGASTIVIIHDVTSRKQAEEKINEQNRFLNKLIESLPHPFFVVGVKDYQVLLANSSAQRYLAGLADCSGQVGQAKACKAPLPYTPFERVQQDKGSFLMEYVEQGKDDQETTYEIHAHPIFDKKGKVTQIIEYRLDITERKKSELALRDSKDELQKALDNLRVAQQVAIRQEKLASIGTLASGVAHEILNPLNIIGTMAQVMQLEKIPVSMRNNLEEMLHQIKRATKITNNLRSFSHQHAFEVSLVDVHELFDKTAALLDHDLKLDNVRVERHYAPDLPRIEADEDQLAQVFLNLLSNARDAMSSSDKRIIVETRPRDGGVEIRFSDTGCGIDPADIVNIFDPFFTTKDPGRGTGLGLWIVYSIIENHCGTIRVESEKGKGAQFVIFLPKHLPGREGSDPADKKQSCTIGGHG